MNEPEYKQIARTHCPKCGGAGYFAEWQECNAWQGWKQKECTHCDALHIARLKSGLALLLKALEGMGHDTALVADKGR